MPKWSGANQQSKEFCYDCLGRIENHLYCEPCYRKKDGLEDTDKIIRNYDHHEYNSEVDFFFLNQ